MVERLNRLMHHWQQDRIATLIYLVINPRNGHMTFASAGHLPPLVCGPDGTARYLGGGEFVPLGVLPFGGFTAGEAVIEPGSTILLYTDGLVEERGVSIEDGLERLRAAIEVAPDDPHAMCDYLLATVPPAGAINDDVALLATRLLPVDSGALELRLPAEPASLALMRRALERWLAAVGVNDDASYEIKVACGEACMNAVEHAYPPGDGDLCACDQRRWRGGDRGAGLRLLAPAARQQRARPRARVDATTDGLDQGRARSGGHHRPPAPQGAQRGVRIEPLAQLDTRTEGNAVIACVIGEVDISNASDIGSALEGSVPQRAIGLILDLSEATYIDSAGVHLLFRLGGRLTRRRQQLRVVVPETARIRKIVNLAGLAWTVPQDNSVAEALSNLKAEVVPEPGEEAWVSGPNAPFYY